MPVIQLDIDASGSVRGIKQYEQAARQGAEATDRLAGSTAKAESSLGDLAKKALAVGTAYLTVASGIEQVSKATKLFVGFDDALRVASSYAGVLDETSQEFGAMATAAKEAGATTSATTTTAAKALGELTSRGLSAQQAITALTPTIRLAEAAQADLGEAAAVSSGIMAGLGKDVSYLSRINDIIVGISGASSLNLEKVGEAAKNAVPAANAAGESLESMVSVVGLLVDKQFRAGAAGNAYENMLISLLSPTSKATSELARMGISTEDSKGKFIGLLPILDQFKAKNLDLPQAVAIFGREWASAALAATSGISEIRKDTNFLENDIDGLTQTASKFQQGGPGGAFRELESAVEAVYIAVGEQLAPVFKKVAGALTGYAGQASAAAEATTILLDGVQFAALAFTGLKVAGQAVTSVVSYIYEGYLQIARLKALPLRAALGLENLSEDAKKELKAVDDEIGATRKAREEINKSIQGSYESYDKINAKIDDWRAKVASAAAEKEKLAKADKDMQTAAEAAGIAAGKAAASQGKSFTEAAAAAEAGKKSYLEQAKAAEQKQAADAKSTASATTAKAALEEQAAAIKQQALSYGYTAEQAQAAADKVLATGKAADGISSAGVDSVAAGLDRAKEKAQEASAALSGIGGGAVPEAPTGGIVSFTADLDLSPYQQKISDLKQDIDNFKANYHTFQLKFDGPPEFAEARKQLGELETAYSKAQTELEKQQGIDSLNQKLKETRSELSQTRQTFADGKLVIDTDPAATAALQGQVQALNDAKLAAGAMGEGFEYVNGVLTNISPAAAAAKAAYDGLADSSGNIATEWRQIDGVWTEVLPNGEKLVDAVNKKMLEGVTATGEFGGAVAAATGQIASGSAEADKIIASLTGSVEKAAVKAGSLKFDELKNSTTALEVVRAQIKSLEGDIKTFGITSEQGQAAVAGILKLEAVESSAQAKIKTLHDEIYGTGEEAKKTTAAVGEIPPAASTAAAAVSDLAAANSALAESTEGIKDAANALQEFGKIEVGTSTFTQGKSIKEMTEGQLDEYIKFQRQVGDALTAQNKIILEGPRLTVDFFDPNPGLKDSTAYDAYFEAEMEKLKRAANTLVEGVEESSRSLRRSGATTLSAGETGAGTGGTETTAQPPATYNFYGYDRSDAADIVNRSNRAARRA